MIKWISDKLGSVVKKTAEEGKNDFRFYKVVPVIYESLNFSERDAFAAEVSALVERGDYYFSNKKEGYVVGKIFDFSRDSARVGVTNAAYAISSAIHQEVYAIRVEKDVQRGCVAVWAEYRGKNQSSGQKPLEIRIIK